MCRADYYDDEFHWLNPPTVVKARKEHRCGDCRRTIDAREHYTSGGGIDMDGNWTSYVQCAHCKAAAAWLVKVCGGWLFNEVGDELREHYRDEPPLRSWALLWLVKAHRRGWRHHGQLLPVERVLRHVEQALRVERVLT